MYQYLDDAELRGRWHRPRYKQKSKQTLKIQCFTEFNLGGIGF
jgi:hypothetical protein